MNSPNSQAGFDHWALVEIMGHQRTAGHVTEETIAGVSMLRVDVPSAPDSQEFTTQYIGVASVFRLTLVTEVAARAALGTWEWRPRSLLSLPLAADDSVEGEFTESGDPFL